jgi:PAS domain S-box-containing protein
MRTLFYSLRFRLSLLVLLAMLPLLGLTLYLSVQGLDQARRNAENDMLRLADLAAEGQATFLESTRQLLFVLSLSPEIQQPQACQAYLAAILSKSTGFANLGVVSPDGSYLCSAAASAAANIADRPYFLEALRTGAFSIGQYQVSRVTHTPTLNFALPLRGPGGQVEKVMVASLDLEWLNSNLKDLNLSADESLIVIDQAGALLGRLPASPDLLGKTFPDTPVVRAILGSAGEGTIEASGLDGVRRIYGFKPLGDQGGSHIFVAVGIPATDAFADANRRATVSLGGLGIMALLAIAASWLFGELFLVHSARRLVATTRRLSDGDLSARTGLAYDPSEPGQLARAVDEMAASLQRSTVGLTHANRTLRMVSDCNQALVRAQSEPPLLEAICRTLVESGGYRMAWVGLAESAPPHRVRPVASAGHVEGYLDGLEIRWVDVPTGQGPTGTAIRTRQGVVAQDFASNPLMAPWRERALARGYAASIALPLIADGGPLGALTVYSGDPQAFQPPEVALLEELAGDLAYGMQALRDRAGRLAAQQELQASEERFRSAFENAAIGMTLTSLDGRLIQVNRAFSRMLGCSAAELEGKEVAAITHPDDLAATQNVLRGGPAGSGDVSHFEKRYLHRDGQAIWAFVSTFLLRSAAGERLYFITQVQDITARKAAQAEVESLARFPSENPHPVLRFSREGRLLYANQASKLLLEACCPDAASIPEAWLGLVQRALETGSLMELEEHYGEVAYHLTFTPIQAAGYVNLYAQDVTSRRRAEEEQQHLTAELERRVEQRTAELSEKNRELETFAYSVSHDLKAPLRGIDGYSQLLLSDYSVLLDEEGQGFLKQIRRATQQMDDLIDDLLAYSRLERRTLAHTSLNLRQVVEMVVAEFEHTLQEGKVELTLDLADVQVLADSENLDQALRNLVDNAIKFSASSALPHIQIHTWQNESSGFLLVRDNGIGFDMRYHDRIFEIFQRLHRSEEYPGTGVGLAIVRKAMERLKGHTWAESAPGEGATFYLEIPLER